MTLEAAQLPAQIYGGDGIQLIRGQLRLSLDMAEQINTKTTRSLPHVEEVVAEC